jgi:hypothetical protein
MDLPRLQLVELNDHERTPAVLRDTIIETLSRALRWGRMLHGLVAPLREFLAAAGTDEVLDVCAGAGGPARVLAAELAAAGHAPRFLLTDLFPRVHEWEDARRAHPGVIDFVAEPVDATAIPADVAGGRARMVVNAFHHFPPALAQAILDDAIAGSRGLFISEAFDRNPLRFLPFAPAALAALAAEPLLARKDRLAKALLAWASPIALTAGIFDGLVSTMRIYEPRDLARMVARHGDRFRWQHGHYRFPLGGRGFYFWGVPR